jgi:DNA polymerase-3 subunit epsilon
MEKIMWFDVETTGLIAAPIYDHKGTRIQSGIIQAAALMQIDGLITERMLFHIRPAAHHTINEEALKVNNFTQEQLKGFPDSQQDFYSTIRSMVSKYVDRYDKHDKCIIAGYNVRFDIDFFRQLFLDNNDKFFGSFFHSASLDVMGTVAECIIRGLQLPNYKLATVCERFGIDLQAHDAMADIIATRNLYYKLKEILKG